MNTKDRAEIINILNQARGDDLARARIAFRGLTEKEMQEKHGQSGRTRAEILAGYEQHNARLKHLIQEMELLPRGL